MFKPSLKRTILKQQMCTYQQKNSSKNHSQFSQTFKNNNRRFIPSHKLKNNIPSMMIPEQVLHDQKFYNNKTYTHTVSPFTYDFHPYPQEIKQIIKQHFNQVEIGVSQQIFYAAHNQKLFLWKNDQKSQQQKISIKSNKFQEKIQIIKVFVMKNPLLFRKTNQFSIVAVTFENRIKLFCINQQNLRLDDLNINYKLGGASRITKIDFTQNNELIICGNNGKISMVSFSSDKQSIVEIKCNPLQKYVSSKAFDYYSEYITKQIAIFDGFLYCLVEKHTKTNMFLYGLKKCLSIFNGKKVNQQNQETYIEIYKLSQERSYMTYVDRLDEKQIQQKLKNSFANYTGQYIEDGFKIVSLIKKNFFVQEKKENSLNLNIKKQEINKIEKMIQEQQSNSQEEEQNQEKIYSLLFKQNLSFITRCGYVITIKHREASLKENKQKLITKSLNKKIIYNFSFVQQPFKIFQKLEKIALVDTIKVDKYLEEKEYRKNYVLTSKGFNNLTIMNNMIIYLGDRRINIINASGIKPIIYQRSKQLTQKPQGQLDKQKKYFQIQNLQREWIVFNSQGHERIYQLKPRHVLLTYLHFKCQISAEEKEKSLNLDKVLDFDQNFHQIIQKLIKIYGYYQFNKIIVELLLNFNQLGNNQNHQRQEYIYMQSQIIQSLLNLQIHEHKYRAFEDWFYQLSSFQAIKIFQSRRISFYLWSLLMQYQYQPLLKTQYQESQKDVTFLNQFVDESINYPSNKYYSSYGYALKSIFYEAIKPILNLRAKQYKQKYLEIKKIQDKLKILLTFLQIKNKKEEEKKFKNYSTQKKQSLNKGFKGFSQKLTNESVSTNYSLINTNQLEGNQSNSKNQFFIQRSNAEVQDKIYKSCQKILTLIQVFSILIQKDQRAIQTQKLPTFVQAMTNYKSQIALGNSFFDEQCTAIFSKQNLQNRGVIAYVLNSQLMKNVQLYLPELGISQKIQYLNFKKAKNVLWAFRQNQNLKVDIKSLDLESLAEITNSSHIVQMRMLFLGTKDLANESNFTCQGKIQKYSQFIIISIQKIIQRHNQLSSLDKKNPIEDQNKFSFLRLTHQDLNRESHIIISQHTQHLQEQTKMFYDQLRNVFTVILQKFNKVTGKQYYQVEKSLEFVLELIVVNCYMDKVVMQFLQQGLKQYKLLQKLMRMKKILQKVKTDSSFPAQKIILVKNPLQVDQIKEIIQQNELSTMQIYLKMSKKYFNTEKTTATEANTFRNKSSVTSQMEPEKN